MLSKNEKKSLDINQILLVIIVAFLGMILIVLVWFAIREPRANTMPNDSAVESAADNSSESQANADIPNVDPKVQEIINKIAQHALLPAGDVSAAEVRNADLLREKDPYTFQYAKNGDQLLVHAERIIIYDPVQDRIVDIVRVPVGSQGSEEETLNTDEEDVDLGENIKE